MSTDWAKPIGEPLALRATAMSGTHVFSAECWIFKEIRPARHGTGFAWQ
jgi:hypothetical protein